MNSPSIKGYIIDVDKYVADNPDRKYDIYGQVNQTYSDGIYKSNARTYSQSITQSTGVKTSAGMNNGKKDSLATYKGTITAHFNNTQSSGNKFLAEFAYASKDIMLEKENFRFHTQEVDVLKKYLSAGFLTDIARFSPEQLVKAYGTHLLTDIITGGKLRIRFQAQTMAENREEEIKKVTEYSCGLTLGKFGLKGEYVSSTDIKNSMSVNQTSANIHYKTLGGDIAKGLEGTLKFDGTPMSLDIANWQSSINSNNSSLVKIVPNTLVYIYEFIDDPVKKEALKLYIDQYLKDNEVDLDWLPQPIYEYTSQFERREQSNTSFWGVWFPNYVYKTYQWYFYTRNRADGSDTAWYSTNGSNNIAYKAFTYKAPNTVPIYRYVCVNNGMDHYYTSAPGNPRYYKGEGIEFYAYKTQLPNTIPVYCHTNPTTWAHYFSTSATAPEGFYRENIAFFVPQ